MRGGREGEEGVGKEGVGKGGNERHKVRTHLRRVRYPFHVRCPFSPVLCEGHSGHWRTSSEHLPPSLLTSSAS